MTFPRGTTVVWTTHDRVTGEIVRSVVTRTVGAPFGIDRSDGTVVECVVLECHRLVPTSEIHLGNEPERKARRAQVAKKSGGETVFGPVSGELVSGSERRSVRPALDGGNPPEMVNRDRDSETAARPVSRGTGHRNDSGDRNSRIPATPNAADAIPVGTTAISSCTGNSHERTSAGTALLAIDFLNLLVRSYHAGAPSEIHAVRGMFQTVASAIRALRPERIVFALDGGHDHRTVLLPQYKAHRPPSEPGLVAQKRLAEDAIRAAGIPAIRITGFEADDVLASIASRHRGTVLCSSDKDLLALAGIARVYHPWSGGQFVTPDEKLGLPAGMVTDYLALGGDSSDGIPGVKGIGPKTAATLLEEYGSLESILVTARSGQIKGDNGLKIAEQASEALLCRQVVELRTELPLPEIAPWRAPAGWQHRLQDMRLGAVAAILSGLLDESEATDRGITESPQNITESARNITESRASIPERNETIVSRSLESMLSQLDRPADWSTPEGALITSWIAGYRCRGADRENPWRSDTDNYVAWSQGYFAEALLIERRKTVRPEHQTESPQQLRKVARSLF